MRPSAGFLLSSSASPPALFALWSFAGVGDLYARVVIAVTNPLMCVVTGFWVDDVRPKDGGLDVYVRSIEQSARRWRPDELVPMQPREQFSGLIPFLALVGASTSCRGAGACAPRPSASRRCSSSTSG